MEMNFNSCNNLEEFIFQDGGQYGRQNKKTMYVSAHR